MSSGSVIHVVFVDIDLESHPRCMNDYVEVSTPSTHSLTASALIILSSHHCTLLMYTHLSSGTVTLCLFESALVYHCGAWGSVVVKAPRYYSGSPGTDSRWCRWGFFQWL